MLKKILFDYQNKTQLIIAMVGAFLGFTFLVTSIHYLIRVNEYGEGEEILGNNTMIIQKKITNLNTLKLASTSFSEKDIDHLKKQEFTAKIEPVVSNNFDITLQTDSDLIPYMRTDVFVQSVKDGFTKINPEQWKWKKGDEFVPIILPREFLVMLNTFATAKGIPPVSDDLAKSVNFKFTLSAKGQREKMDVRIVGFTSEVSAILVPSSFMEYGNSNFQKDKASEITQLMISVKEGLFGEYENYINRHAIESKENSMVVGKLKSVAGTLFSILITISVITVFLAGLVLIQYAQLLISRNEYKIKTLLHLGYSPNKIIKTILQYFIKVFAFISAGSIITFALLKFFIDQILITGGIHINANFTLTSFLAVILAFAVYSIVNYFNAKRGVLGTL